MWASFRFSDRPLKIGDALGEFVALFDLVIHAARKNLDPCFYRFEARTDALEAVIDGMVQIAKLPLGSSRQHINLFGDALKMLFEAVEALLKLSLVHTGEV
jgi:hypothetical protein